MNAQLLIYGFAPLLVYFLVDYWKGFRAGVMAAIVVSLVVVVMDYIQTGSLDYFVIGETSLIIALGYVSLRMNKDNYFKFQPAVVAAVFVIVFGYFQIFDQPLMVRYIPRVEQFILASSSDPANDPDVQQLLSFLKDPMTIEMFGKLSAGFIGLFLVHGLIMVYAAMRLSTGAWFAWRLAIYPGAMVLTIAYRLTLGA